MLQLTHDTQVLTTNIIIGFVSAVLPPGLLSAASSVRLTLTFDLPEWRVTSWIMAGIN